MKFGSVSRTCGLMPSYSQEISRRKVCSNLRQCIMLGPILYVPGRMQKRELWWFLGILGRNMEVGGRGGTSVCSTKPSDVQLKKRD